MVAEQFINNGFNLYSDGDRLIVEPASKLTDEQRQLIRLNKVVILAELKGRSIIRQLAQVFNWPVDDLLSWYKEDLQDFASMPTQQSRWIVLDYLTSHHGWKPGKPYQIKRRQLSYGG